MGSENLKGQGIVLQAEGRIRKREGETEVAGTPPLEMKGTQPLAIIQLLTYHVTSLKNLKVFPT